MRCDFCCFRRAIVLSTITFKYKTIFTLIYLLALAKEGLYVLLLCFFFFFIFASPHRVGICETHCQYEKLGPRLNLKNLLRLLTELFP